MKILAAISILIFVSLGSRAQDSLKPPAESATPMPQQLRVLSQEDAPLRIVSAKITWATPSDRFAVQVYPVVENVSKKSIATYSTRWETNPLTGAKRCLGPPVLPAKGLLPGETAGTSTWQGDSHFDPAPAIWVDFVQFLDGTRWGADECQIGESTDGGVAGARAQRDQLLAMFREKGADALMTFIRENFQRPVKVWEGPPRRPERIPESERRLLPIGPPPGHSRRWEEAFSAGAEGVLKRVVEAERKYGSDEIEHELSRPIGPSENKSP